MANESGFTHEDSVYAVLLEAQEERRNGYSGRNACDVLRDMERVVEETAKNE